MNHPEEAIRFVPILTRVAIVMNSGPTGNDIVPVLSDLHCDVRISVLQISIEKHDPVVVVTLTSSHLQLRRIPMHQAERPRVERVQQPLTVLNDNLWRQPSPVLFFVS